MARSSGARPKKAQREEYALLKAELAKCRSNEWQRAQLIFDQMCAVCDAKGPSGSKMTPRSCRICGYYGHTSQFCPVDAERMMLQAKREAAQNKPIMCEAECTLPGQWAWICATRALEKRREEGIARGVGRCLVYADKSVPFAELQKVIECGCKGCKEWNEWMNPWVSAVNLII